MKGRVAFIVAMGGGALIGAVIGALIGGPVEIISVGIIAGEFIGMVGGVVYTAANTKKFKPLHQVLDKMTKEDKEKLVEAAKRIIERKGIDLAHQVIGKYGSQFARTFLIDVYNEFSGKTVGN